MRPLLPSSVFRFSPVQVSGDAGSPLALRLLVFLMETWPLSDPPRPHPVLCPHMPHPNCQTCWHPCVFYPSAEKDESEKQHVKGVVLFYCITLFDFPLVTDANQGGVGGGGLGAGGWSANSLFIMCVTAVNQPDDRRLTRRVDDSWFLSEIWDLGSLNENERLRKVLIYQDAGLF